MAERREKVISVESEHWPAEEWYEPLQDAGSWSLDCEPQWGSQAILDFMVYIKSLFRWECVYKMWLCSHVAFWEGALLILRPSAPELC